MHNRREFLKRVGLISGAASFAYLLPEAIERAFAIDPEPGSTFLDAEHVVILMQENRSFDHAFGCLRGVRGFDDPRALTLPNGNPVWVQTNDAGESYLPFRLNIKETKATWMGSLPHSWTDQVDARNGGGHDRWLQAKKSGNSEFADMPLTLGYYNRDDIPFYYALADAFTICDQHFCSCLTGTTANRLHLWTGTIRARQTADSPAQVLNSDVDLGSSASWTTFPERLEDNGIVWKVYQNELSVPTGFVGDEELWLGNFDDNPLEYFTQYNVRMAPAHRQYMAQLLESLPTQLQALEEQVRANPDAPDLHKQIAEKREMLRKIQADAKLWNQKKYEKLTARETSLHDRAFCANTTDPHYRQLETLTYRDGGVERQIQVPKGDVLHQFRQDVRDGKLPTVSWLVAPEAFSDHPSSAWFGAWYIAEVLDILTKDPAVWKKTIFMLTYDENDGYFDHVPPFCAPDPRKPESGRVSPGIEAELEFVTLEEELRRKPASQARENSIGLGYRVPLVIASPWSRGGCVNSQVFDHTSSLQFLEKFLTHKSGKSIKEPNINSWRRTVCGDLSSTFQPFSNEATTLPSVVRDSFVEEIHKAKFKDLPSTYKPLSATEIEKVQHDPALPNSPRQEPGLRRSAPLPYELIADGVLADDGRHFEIRFEARNKAFGDSSAGAPFIAYARTSDGKLAARNYAVRAGDRLTDSWAVDDFDNGQYDLTVYGPNGFYRSFRGTSSSPEVEISLIYSRTAPSSPAPNGNIAIQIVNHSERQRHTVVVRDLSYDGPEQVCSVSPRENTTLMVNTRSSYGWYDLSVQVVGDDSFEERYAGRVETGQWSYSDPVIGKTTS